MHVHTHMHTHVSVERLLLWHAKHDTISAWDLKVPLTMQSAALLADSPRVMCSSEHLSCLAPDLRLLDVGFTPQPLQNWVSRELTHTEGRLRPNRTPNFAAKRQLFKCRRHLQGSQTNWICTNTGAREEALPSPSKAAATDLGVTEHPV